MLIDEFVVSNYLKVFFVFDSMFTVSHAPLKNNNLQHKMDYDHFYVILTVCRKSVGQVKTETCISDLAVNYPSRLQLAGGSRWAWPTLFLLQSMVEVIVIILGSGATSAFMLWVQLW